MVGIFIVTGKFIGFLKIKQINKENRFKGTFFFAVKKKRKKFLEVLF